MTKENPVINVIRIDKKNVPSIQSKQVFYYIDTNKDEEEKITNVSYVLLDNRKGKKELTKFKSIKDLEKSLK